MIIIIAMSTRILRVSTVSSIDDIKYEPDSDHSRRSGCLFQPSRRESTVLGGHVLSQDCVFCKYLGMGLFTKQLRRVTHYCVTYCFWKTLCSSVQLTQNRMLTPSLSLVYASIPNPAPRPPYKRPVLCAVVPSPLFITQVA